MIAIDIIRESLQCLYLRQSKDFFCKKIKKFKIVVTLFRVNEML